MSPEICVRVGGSTVAVAAVADRGTGSVTVQVSEMSMLECSRWSRSFLIPCSARRNAVDAPSLKPATFAAGTGYDGRQTKRSIL